jgi:hypothetical protein
VSVLKRLFTEALGRGAFVERGMRSPEIVVVEVSREAIGSLDGGCVGSFVGPFAQEGLDEAFGFSVGLRAVGASSKVSELKLLTGGCEPVGAVAGAVVGHDGLDADAATLEPGDRAFEKAGGGRGSFIGEYLGVGEARSVIDSDMNELPADAADFLRAVAMDAMTDTPDAAQLLDVHVDELAGLVPLVSANGFFGLQALESRQAMAGQDASDCGRTKAHAGSDLGAGVAAPTKADHLLGSIRMSLPRHPMRPRAAIDQGRLAGLSISPLPLESRPSRDSRRRGGPGHGHPSEYSSDKHESTGGATSGILVKLHLGSFSGLLALSTYSLTDLGPDGQLQTPTVNNVLRNDT